MPFDNDKRAELLYRAVVATLEDRGVIGLLAVGGDVKAKLEYGEASPKTKAIFTALAANLTALERDATLES